MKVRAMSCAVAWLLAAASLAAHHAFTAEYDPGLPVELTGRIVKVEWTNPHSFVDVEIKTADGKLETWHVEGAGPAKMAEQQLSREMLAIDTVVTITGFRGKLPGSFRAWGNQITFPNGDVRQLSDARMTVVPDDLPPPTFIEQLASRFPNLPYLVAAVPVVILLVGMVILRRRRGLRSMPE